MLLLCVRQVLLHAAHSCGARAKCAVWLPIVACCCCCLSAVNCSVAMNCSVATYCGMLLLLLLFVRYGNCSVATYCGMLLLLAS
jgi:hypothetical protein